MDGLSLTQPWGTLMVRGRKRIETRSFRPPARLIGQTHAIHASMGFPKWARETINEEPFLTALNRMGYHELPVGAIVGLGRLVEVRPTEEWLQLGISPTEEEFGDYGEGRFGWRYEDLVELPTPVLCKGALGFWRVPLLIEDMVIGQLERMPC